MNREMERLQPALESYNMDSLRDIAETLGLALPKPPRKQQLVNDLCQVIPQRAGNPEFINALSAAEREVLKQMVKLDRVCDHRDIALPLIKQGMVFVWRLASTKAQPSVDAVLESLLYKGMIMNSTQLTHSSDRRQFAPLLNFSIPPEVRGKLAKVLTPAEDARMSDQFSIASAPDSVQYGNFEEFLRQLFFTWSELRRKPAKLLKSGDIGKRDRRWLAEGLGLSEDQDLHRIQLLYAVLKALNLVEINGNRARAADNHAVTLFWNTSPVGQMRELLNAYPQLDLPVAYNVRPLSEFSYYGGPEKQPDSEIRKVILAILGHLSDASWVSYHLFYALATSGASGYLALSSSSLQMLINNLRWYGLSRKGQLQNQFEKIENEIVTFVLNEMLMLGFVDFGNGQEQNSPPKVIRISELLHAHYIHKPWSRPQEQGQVVLQPDSQLLAMGPVPLHILANLERVAVREKHDPECHYVSHHTREYIPGISAR